ncbi:MAG: hypothetical protein AAFQ82_01860 [Myxococcota bacterium]
MTASAPESQPKPDVALVSIEMGYGHMRAAHALAEHLDTETLHVDRPPLASEDERKSWERTRAFYETTSRLSTLPLVGRPFKAVIDSMTEIPTLYPYRDLSAPHLGVKLLDRMVQRGMGQGMVSYLRENELPLLTTFYAPAIIADRMGLVDVYCVVTDVDIHRIWVSIDPADTATQYLVPSEQAARRLAAYGVPKSNVHFTGFPLPPSLLGGPELPVLRNTLKGRIERLDPKGTFRRQSRDEIHHFLGELPHDPSPKPPHLVFAVGGAGAQSTMVDMFLPSLAGALRSGQLRLTLIAGIRDEVNEYFLKTIQKHGLDSELGNSLQILHEPDLSHYFPAFNRLLADADILWTKPSEMTFFGALGIPLILSWPVGVHERYNRRWAMERGAGIKQRDPRHVGEWLRELLAEGTLAAAAWSGFTRLPKFGVYRIAEVIANRRLGE